MYIDLIVIAVILISAGLAFFRGFIRETLTILGVVGGLLAAYQFGDNLIPLYNNLLGVGSQSLEEGAEAEKFLGVLEYAQLSKVLSYASVFLGVVILLSVVSFFLSRAVEKIGLGMVDRSLGVVFGIIRGVLILGLIYLPFQMFLEEEEKVEWFSDSRSIVYIEWTAEWIRNFFPEDLTNEDAINTKADEARETLKSLEILPEGLNQNSLFPEGEEMDGYQEKARETLDQLIEKEQEQEEGEAKEDGQKDN